ncbi:MAG: HD domain-containing protein [Intestinibacter bartlettii]|uniref:HD domain-containing protein n=1 Tax=Intestinibacter bartlettii TaxID=261299 RepID=UPI0026EC14E1|nr:HD domain-containing protein [Intestinibacter bartlettii]MDO5011384.1 HD domain-containing protein [Intestinibacter bartlettii]
MLSYNEQFQLALELAVKKHKNQTDKSGNPYILHPLHVMETVKTKEAKIVALLHDIIEDTDVTKDYLLEIGISKHIVDAVVALTRFDVNQDYQEYIKNLSSNPLAKEVKLADLEHNMDLKRLPSLSQKDLDRNIKYQIAYYYLINNK